MKYHIQTHIFWMSAWGHNVVLYNKQIIRCCVYISTPFQNGSLVMHIVITTIVVMICKHWYSIKLHSLKFHFHTTIDQVDIDNTQLWRFQQQIMKHRF